MHLTRERDRPVGRDAHGRGAHVQLGGPAFDERGTSKGRRRPRTSRTASSVLLPALLGSFRYSSLEMVNSLGAPQPGLLAETVPVKVVRSKVKANCSPGRFS